MSFKPITQQHVNSHLCSQLNLAHIARFQPKMHAFTAFRTPGTLEIHVDIDSNISTAFIHTSLQFESEIHFQS